MEKAKVDELLSVHSSEYGEMMEYLLVNIGFKQGNAVSSVVVLNLIVFKSVWERYF